MVSGEMDVCCTNHHSTYGTRTLYAKGPSTFSSAKETRTDSNAVSAPAGSMYIGARSVRQSVTDSAVKKKATKRSSVDALCGGVSTETARGFSAIASVRKKVLSRSESARPVQPDYSFFGGSGVLVVLPSLGGSFFSLGGSFFPVLFSGFVPESFL